MNINSCMKASPFSRVLFGVCVFPAPDWQCPTVWGHRGPSPLLPRLCSSCLPPPVYLSAAVPSCPVHSVFRGWAVRCLGRRLESSCQAPAWGVLFVPVRNQDKAFKFWSFLDHYFASLKGFYFLKIKLYELVLMIITRYELDRNNNKIHIYHIKIYSNIIYIYIWCYNCNMSRIK